MEMRVKIKRYFRMPVGSSLIAEGRVVCPFLNHGIRNWILYSEFVSINNKLKMRESLEYRFLSSLRAKYPWNIISLDFHGEKRIHIYI